MLWLYTKVQVLRATRDRGATAAEYALIIAFVAVVIAALVVLFGDAIRDRFQQACTSVRGDDATAANCGTP